MAYDVTKIMVHSYGVFDFGGGAAEIYSFRGPPGYKGRLLNIGVSIVEVCAFASTVGSVKVGSAADDNAYGELNIPDATADKDYFDVSDDTNAVIAADIAADALVQVTMTNGTDSGTVKGQGIVDVVVEWYKH